MTQGTFTALVHKTIELAKAHAEQERADLEALPRTGPGGLRTLADYADQLLRDRSPAHVALYGHLETLSEEDAYKLQSLMYLGRMQWDRDRDVHDWHEELAGVTPDADNAIQTLVEKPLSEYLAAGLRRAREDGTDLEGPFGAS
jgi:hypothetical protein